MDFTTIKGHTVFSPRDSCIGCVSVCIQNKRRSRCVVVPNRSISLKPIVTKVSRFSLKVYFNFLIGSANVPNVELNKYN